MTDVEDTTHELSCTLENEKRLPTRVVWTHNASVY